MRHNKHEMKKADRHGPAFLVWFVDRVDQPLHISQSGPFSMEQAATCSSVSYTHLTLPTNREV